MSACLWPALCVALTVAAPDAASEAPTDGACPGGYLYEPAFCLDDCRLGQPRPYAFQEGDLMLATEDKFFFTATHACAFAFHPHHSGIFYKKPDGTIALLEAGPSHTLWIRCLACRKQMSHYEDYGRVWIRRRAVPLTPEQSACLTNFALQQDGKHFAVGRLCLQLTPFRDRGPVRTQFVGGPHGPGRRTYYCAELVMEALVAAGLADPQNTRPSATYPRDIFYGSSYNPWIDHHVDLNGAWDPPARWVSHLEDQVPISQGASIISEGNAH
jgi:hypothetical protein